jgi:hypothetical protein
MAIRRLYYAQYGEAFTFGVVTNEYGTIIEVPPVVKWLKGKNIEALYDYVYRRRGTIQEVQSFSPKEPIK